MEYTDPESGEKYIPYCIEPSLGADRVALAFLVDAYDEEVVDPEKNDTRVVMHFHPGARADKGSSASAFEKHFRGSCKSL